MQEGRLPWLSFPAPGRGIARRLLVDAEQVRAARGALTRGDVARGEHAFERLARIERLLAGASPGEALGADPALATASGAPEALRRALAWLHPRVEERRARALDVAWPACASLLARDEGSPRLRAALALTDLVYEAPPSRPGLGPLLELLVAAAAVPLGAGLPILRAVQERAQSLQPLRRGRRARPGPWPWRSRLGQRGEQVDLIAAFVLHIHAQRRSLRRRLAEALQALPPLDLERRRAWWRRLEGLASDLRASERGTSRAALELLQQRLRALRVEAPAAHLGGETFKRLDCLAQRPRLLRALVSSARVLPRALRARWFERWASEPQAEEALAAISALAAWLDPAGPLALSAEAREALVNRLDLMVRVPAPRRPRALASLRSFLELAGASESRLPTASCWSEGLRAFEAQGAPLDALGRVLAELPQRVSGALSAINDLSDPGQRLCGVLAPLGGERLAAALTRLTEAKLDREDEARLLALAKTMSAADLLPLFAEGLVHEPLASLLAPAHLLCAARALAPQVAHIAAEPRAEALPAWAAAYPAPLHPQLLRLCGLVPRPELIAARALHRDLPTPCALEREIAALRSRVAREGDAAGRYQRLASLEARRAQTTAPARVERAKARLGARLRRARLARLEQALLGAAESAFEQVVGVPLPAAWLREPRVRTCLLNLATLDETHAQPAAWALLRARLGPPPWDLREHPANRAFARRVAVAGLRLEPWRDGIGAQVRPAQDGQALVLQLESDPLEVLQMGAYFETCLSPGDVNYFSTVSNAADLNKRVLYARDLAGRVVGRCLLALHPQQGLVCFRAYAHEARLGFDLLAAEFARDLARAIGTRPVASAPVKVLASAEWYDDGAVDLCETRAFLSDPESEFRRAVVRADPEDLPRLLAGVSPAPTPALVGALLSLPCFDARPELATGLFGHVRGLVPGARLRFGVLLAQSGARAPALELLRSVLRRRLDPAQRRRLAQTLCALGEPGLARRAARTRTSREERARLLSELAAGSKAL